MDDQQSTQPAEPPKDAGEGEWPQRPAPGYGPEFETGDYASTALSTGQTYSRPIRPMAPAYPS